MSGSSDSDPLKLFRDMKLPSMPDMEAVLSTYRRNLEVLSQANRVALEGAQAVARRHMEILQQTMAELTETMTQLTAVESPSVKAAKQADLLKHAYERAVSNTREIRDLIQHANAEALDLLNRRFLETMDEVKVLMEKAAAGHGGPGG
jgi:phasin family protein